MNCWSRGTFLLLGALAAGAAFAGDDPDGNLVGFIEDGRGAPIPGAVISLFAKGMRGGGFVTLSDQAGRFFLPSLPAGSYTLRALGSGHRPIQAQKITVLPNQDFILSLSLPALGELSPEQAKARGRELTWLVQHKRRSVLEARDAYAWGSPEAEPSAGLLERFGWPELDGTVEFVANPQAFGARPDYPLGDPLPAGSGVLRLKGRIADSASFSLAGLVAESEDRSWRMAAEFTVEPQAGHRIRAGAGYGTRFLRPLSTTEAEAEPDKGVGALFVEEQLELARGVTASLGVRHSYVGFVQDRNHFDPAASVEVRAGDATRFRGSVTARTLVPGGDLLTVSSLSSAPAIAYARMSDGLRPERTVRYELAAERDLGGAWLGVRAFQEGTRDQLVNAFAGHGSARSLSIVNGADVRARGVGVELARSFGEAVRGSVAYSYGRARREVSGLDPLGGPAGPLWEGDFHDVAARVETFVEWTDTRLVAFYRVNALGPDDGQQPVRTTRFDFQLSQGLPFLGTLTSADWDLLIAVRNLFYETSEGAILDEVVVVNPPTRVLGGISVRF